MQGRCMEKTTYFFDFDNTIVDSLEHWHKVMTEEAFPHYGLEVDEKLKDIWEGKTNPEFAQAFIEFAGLDATCEEVIDFWCKAMEEKYKSEVKPIEGVEKFLLSLKKQGKTLVLASATEESLLNAILKPLGLDVFDKILTERNIGAPKRDPHFYETSFEKLGVKAQEVILFEDSFGSLKSANSLGVFCVGVINKFNVAHKEEMESFCKLVIENYVNIQEKLENVYKKAPN